MVNMSFDTDDQRRAFASPRALSTGCRSTLRQASKFTPQQETHYVDRHDSSMAQAC